MEDQKIIHVTRSQEWTAECIDEPLDHNKTISSRQALDIHGSGVCTRLKHYQLVPSQYKSCGSWVRGKRGYGLAVGRRESLFWGSRSNSFGENVLIGWHITQKRKWWVRTSRCMPWRIVRENTHPAVDKNAMVDKQTKQFSLSDNREWHGQHKWRWMGNWQTSEWSRKTPTPRQK